MIGLFSVGETVPLVVDSTTGARRCAAFWPRSPGWHVLRQGDAMIFDPRRLHSFRNPSAVLRSTAIFVITPPPR